MEGTREFNNKKNDENGVWIYAHIVTLSNITHINEIISKLLQRDLKEFNA